MTPPYNPVSRYCTDPEVHGPHDWADDNEFRPCPGSRDHHTDNHSMDPAHGTAHTPEADTHGDLLRRAASLVRLRAFGAPPGSYTVDTRRTPDDTVMVFADAAPFAVATDAEPEQTASHIVLWHPEAALAVADWLEHAAGHGEISPHALVTARTLTGETP